MSDLTVEEAKTMKASEIAPRLLGQKIGEDDLLQFLLNLKAETGDDKLSMAVLKEEPIKWISVRIKFLDQQGAFQPTSSPTRAPDAGDLLTIGAATAGAAGALALMRVRDLLAGNEMKYAAPFKIMDLRNKLQTALGKTMDVNLHQSTLTVVEVDGEKPVCDIFVTVEGEETTVNVSGLDTDDVKGSFQNLLETADEGFDQKQRGVDLSKIGKNLIGAAASVIGEGFESFGAGKTIAETIEKYGSELERKLRQKLQQQAQVKADHDATEKAKTICPFCNEAHGGGSSCKNCGASTGL